MVSKQAERSARLVGKNRGQVHVREAVRDPDLGHSIEQQLIGKSEIAAAIRSLLGARAPTASICPSDAARYLESSPSRWRALMPAIRDAAAALARDGELRITRGKEELSPDALTGGPIRLRRGPKWRG